MKIQTIEIINFKGVEHQTCTFTDKTISLLLGHNGKGKTSFIEALQWGLTGVLPQNPVRDGCECAVVKIILADGTSFSRTVFKDNRPSKVEIDGRITPAKNLNILLNEKFGFSSDILKVAISADTLLSMKSEQLGDFLLKYIPEALNADKVLGYMSEITEEMQEVVLTTLPEDDFEIDAIELAYKDFAENRKIAKKDLAFIENKLAKLPGFEPKRPLDVVKMELEDLLKQEGAAKLSRNALNAYDDAVKRREAALRNIEELQSRFNSISAARPNPAVREEYIKTLSDAESKKRSAESMINIMNNTVKTLSVTLERLSTNHCPLSDSLICTTDKTSVKDEIVNTIKSNNDGINIQKEIAAKASSEISNINSLIKAFDENAVAYKEKILVGEQLEKAKKNLPDIPVRPATVAERNFEDEKNILKAEIDYAQKWAEREKLEKQRVEEEKRVRVYDLLCKSFDGKGEVMTGIVSSYLSLFEEEANQRAEVLRTGMQIKFVPENGVKYLIKMKEDKDFHPYDDLSKGEKTLAAFVLLDLIVALCNTRIMILDDLNNLDKPSFEEMMRFISTPEYLGCYDHIILASIDHEAITDVIDEYPVIHKIF